MDEAILTREFFARGAERVARDLLGCLLVVRGPDRDRICRIVETEAYVGAHDLACHASKGRTPRTEPMFGEAGHAYVYFVYGMHHMLNVVTGPLGDPQAVLIRGAEWWPGPQDASLAGPAKLCKALGILTGTHNRMDVCGGDVISFLERPDPVPLRAICSAARIGVDYAGEWAVKPLRYYLEGSPGVSRRA